MNTVTLLWTGVANAQSYRLRYKKSAGPDWLIVNTDATEFTLMGLDSCSNYDFAVQSICLGGVESDVSDLFNFMTSCPSAVRDVTGDFESFTVHPNPFTGSIWLNFSLKKSQDALIELFDARGQRIHLAEASFQAGRNLWQLAAASEILSQLPQGIYFVKMTSGNGYAVCKLMKR
jgi:hypothetical protein